MCEPRRGGQLHSQNYEPNLALGQAAHCEVLGERNAGTYMGYNKEHSSSWQRCVY